MMVGASDRGLEIGDEGVDPFEHLEVAGLARADDDGSVLGHHRPGGGEARPPVGDQVNGFVQRRAFPARHRRSPEIRDRLEAHMLRMSLVVKLNGGYERHFVFRSSPRLAGMHTAEVGVVGQHDPGEQTARFALGHGLQQFVLDPPGGAVAHTQMPLEGERRDVALVLRDQVDGLEPLGQGQLGGVEKRVGANRGLCPAARALPVLAPVGQKRGVRGFAALRADESRRPARPLQRDLALGLGSESLDELAQ